MKIAPAAACAAALVLPFPVGADVRPDSHAPIGVMGDHTHKAGETMFSYRVMRMSMKGNAEGSSGRSPEDIVTTIPNRFANPPMQPPTLRVVPMHVHAQSVLLHTSPFSEEWSIWR